MDAGERISYRITPKHRLALARLLAFAFVVGLSVFVFSIRDQAERLAIYGYPGIFLLSFLGYATVLLPAPVVGIVFTMAGVFHPIGVALVAATGAALGEISGYLAGFSSQVVAERAEIYQKLTRWMQKNGPLTVFLLSSVPNPFFDLAGMAAGLLKMPLPQFLIWCWLGECVKMLFFAYIGSTSLNWFFGQ